jgi:hypothetical protein
MRWDKELGWWTLIKFPGFQIFGTTPRNADYFTLTVDIGTYEIHWFLGPHVGIEFWHGDKMKEYELRRKNCPCWDCAIRGLIPEAARAALSPETIRVIEETKQRMVDKTSKKIPPKDRK